jgi:hypothetical protein
VLSAALIIIGLLLGTVSVVTSYAKAQLADTDGFVALFAPLAHDPEVQTVVSNAVTDAVQDAVDIPSLTAEVFDGIRSLDIPDDAATALSLLEAPTVHGLNALVASIIDGIITSDMFADVWEQALRTSHAQIVAALSGDPGSALTLGQGGTLQLQLGPIVDAVRERLLADGISFAGAIPAVDQTITLIPASELGSAATGYALLMIVAVWLPWTALALLAGGVLLARTRRRALIATSITTMALMLLLGLLLTVGRAVVIGQLVGTGGAATVGAGGVVYDTVTAPAGQLAVAIGLLAAVIAATAWLVGSRGAPLAVREGIGAVAAFARGAGRTGRWRTVGDWVNRRHRTILLTIAVLGAAVVLLVRPLTPALVITTALIAGAVVLGLQFLRHPAQE